MKTSNCSNPSCGIAFKVGPGSTGKYCSRSCAVTVNNSKSPKRHRKHDAVICPCGQKVERYERSAKYCSHEHSVKYRASSKVDLWLSGEWDGSTKTGLLSKYIRNYLLEEADHNCTRCGWGEVNPLLDKPILTVDHIDGDWKNNKVDNLVVLCYNCHTLTPTFNALNKSNPNRQGGRQYNHRHMGD